MATEPKVALTGRRLASGPRTAKRAYTRIFRDWTGLPPGEYILRRRVERARHWLGDPTLSIKEVAARSGFDDPYYFSKAFRRIDGLPPTRFREALLASRRANE